MVDGRAYDRQPESDIHGLAKSRIFEDGQSLVVVHREYGVFVSGRLSKSRVRGQRATNFFATGSKVGNDGSDNVLVFVAEMTAFTRMRI